MCWNEYSNAKSYAIFSTPQTTSGNPANEPANIMPAKAGLMDDASVRGTAVKLAAAKHRDQMADVSDLDLSRDR